MDHHEIPRTPVKTIIFIVIGGVLIVMTDLFVLGGIHHIWKNKVNLTADGIQVSDLKKQHHIYMTKGIELGQEFYPHTPIPSPDKLKRKDDFEFVQKDKNAPLEIDSQTEEMLANITPAIGTENNDIETIPEIIPPQPAEKNMADVILRLSYTEPNIQQSQDVPEEDTYKQSSKENILQYSYDEPEAKGMIAIIIDDMGLGLRSKQVEVMQGPLTLSYLPYAKNLNERTQRAKENGHELMLHMPMEPLNDDLDGGPNVLKTSQNEEDFSKTLEWGLTSYDGFVGLNNHMGSRLTKDRNAMARVMQALKARGLFFVDSKTIGGSIGAEEAKNAGIPYAERDVFLDHEITKDFVKEALKNLENTAHKKGYAIAIGHPHKETIEVLKEWIPTLADKGLALVPVSKLVKYPRENEQTAQSNP